MFSFTGLFAARRLTCLPVKKKPIALFFIYKYTIMSLCLKGVFYHYSFVYNTPYKFLLKYVMAGITLNHVATFSVFSAGLIWLYLKKIIFFTRKKSTFWTIKNATSTFTLIEPLDVYKFVGLQLLALSQYKVMPGQWCLPDKIWFFNVELFLILIIILVYMGGKITKDVRELNLIFVIMIFFFIAITSFFFANNLLMWFLALELIGVVYYFFFLYTLSRNTLTVIKYKNLLSNYLWMSFFLLVFLAALMFCVINTVGSLHFGELMRLCQNIPVLWHLIILVLLWKTGAPGFHFLKFELYQYMPVYTLIAFSAISLFVNFFVLQFLASIVWYVLITFRFYFLIYVLIVNVVLLVRGLGLTSFYQFLGLSALNTTTLLFMFFLI